MKINILSAIFFILIFASCEKIIDLEIPDAEKKIVLNAIISPDSIIKVNVSKSLGVLEEPDENIFLENATVKIFENKVEKGNLTYESFGYYSINYLPVAKNNYKISVEHSQMTSVFSEITIPDKVLINKIDTQTYATTTYDEWSGEYSYKTLEFKVNFTDPEEPDNYYFIAMATYDYETDPDSLIITDSTLNGYCCYSDDILLQIENNFFSLKNLNGYAIPDDNFNGSSINFSFKSDITTLPYYEGFPGFTFEAYLFSVDENLYNYIISYNKASYTGSDPFTQPVIIYSNIENGIGIFSGVNIDKKSVYLKLSKK